MVSIFVTGANRGIGLGLVKELLKRDDVVHVFATTRAGSTDKELRSLKDPRLHVLEMNVTDDRSIAVAAGKVREITGSAGLNVLINNSGVFTEYNVEKSVNRKVITDVLDVNTVAPLIVTQSFLEHLRTSAGNGAKSIVATISSGFGSIARCDGSHGRDAIAYNMSKAAVNMMTKTLAEDWKKENITVVSFCPGWVRTDMGSERALLSLMTLRLSAHNESVEESTSVLVDSILNKVKIEHTGGFFERDFDPIPY